MTTEGMLGVPLDATEMKHAMVGLAEATSTFKRALVIEGFSETQAFELTQVWLRGVIAGSRAEQ